MKTTLLTILLLATTACGQLTTAWASKVKITVHHEHVDALVMDFPLLVRFANTNLAAAQADADDPADGQVLPLAIEREQPGRIARVVVRPEHLLVDAPARQPAAFVNSFNLPSLSAGLPVQDGNLPSATSTVPRRHRSPSKLTPFGVSQPRSNKR